MVKLKSINVNLDNVHPKIYYAIFIAADVYEQFGCDELVITSCRDSKHSTNSLHYKGEAFDIRIWNLPKQVLVNKVSGTIQSRLGNDFDVVLELDKNHIHIEYDPK